MNIPESAIQPFQPLGIPKLKIMSYASIIEALDKTFETMNRIGEAYDFMYIDGIELLFTKCLQEMGVFTSKVLITQFCYTECDVNICYVTNRALKQYSGTIHSTGGFKKVVW
jgi:hypothetical protein